MTALRWILLALLALVPLASLIHRDDLGRWDSNRSLMVAPDEFSYLLTAQSILHAQGISTQKTLGLDTFYPPGYPLLLAAWTSATGRGEVTPFSAHLFNALLLSAATIVAYLFSRRLLLLLASAAHPRFRWGGQTARWLALLIAGLFATNWHVLEGALFILSEPAFMLAVFAWLALALRWPQWHLHPRQTLLVALCAIAAWSIRGAGLTCVAATLLFPLATLFQSTIKKEGQQKSKIACILLILALALSYHFALSALSPEKSLSASAASANSYPRQLLNGITNAGEFQLTRLRDWPELAAHLANLAASHLDDYAASFTPWLRESPDLLFLNTIAKILGLLGLAGFLYHLARANPSTRLLELFLLLYFALYLLWPFNMPRFWAPILPLMLAYASSSILFFWTHRTRFPAPLAAALLLAFLLLLNVRELTSHLGDYQRRLNYVSDGLAGSAAAICKLSPDPLHTIVVVAGDDERFVFDWYLPRAYGPRSALPQPSAPEPHSPPPTGPRESLEHALLRSIAATKQNPQTRLFVISYFTEPYYPAIFENLRRLEGNAPDVMQNLEIHRVYQREHITTVWEIISPPHPATPLLR